MAKRKTKTTTPRTTVTKRPGGVVVVKQSSPVQRAKSSGRRIAHAASNAGIGARMQGAFVGGLALGFIEKTFGDKIPSIPLVGRKGAIALGVYFLKPKNRILQDVGVVAAALSGHQLSKEGTVSGDDDDEYVSGVAAQL